MLIKYAKRFSAAVFVVLIIICTPFCVFAESTGRLIDEAELYTAAQQEELNKQLRELSIKTGWNAVIYTNYNGCDEDDIKAYSNRYYADNYGKTSAGVILTVDMLGRAVDFRAKGGAMQYFSDNRVDTILDDIQSCLSSEQYYDAAERFIKYIGDYYDAGIPEGESNEYLDIQEQEDHPFLYVVTHYGIFIVIASLGISVLAVVLIRYRYSRNGMQNIYDLRANSKINLTDKQDVFLTKHVSVTNISSSSSGGGSHSGGGSSGGGGSSTGGSRSF